MFDGTAELERLSTPPRPGRGGGMRRRRRRSNDTRTDDAWLVKIIAVRRWGGSETHLSRTPFSRPDWAKIRPPRKLRSAG